MIEDAVRAVLGADPVVVAAAIGGIQTPPIQQITTPSTQLPVITVQRISGAESVHQDGTGTSSTRIQVDCWSQKYRDSRELARKCRAALNGFPRAGQLGLQGGERLFLIAQIEGSDSNDYDPETKLHRATADFRVEAAAEAAA